MLGQIVVCNLPTQIQILNQKHCKTCDGHPSFGHAFIGQLQLVQALFFGSGEVIAQTGPVGAIIAYIF